MGRRLKETVSKEETQMAKKMHEKMVNISNYQKNAFQNYSEKKMKKESKTTARFHLTPVRMTVIKTINTGEDVEKREPSNTIGGNVNWQSHYGEKHGGSFKN